MVNGFFLLKPNLPPESDKAAAGYISICISQKPEQLSIQLP